jgi:hypothetical protein
MKIKITQEDINKGVRGDSSHCPIAHAFCRNGYNGVRVEARRIYPYGYTYDPSNVFKNKFIIMPDIGHDFVVNFDSNNRVEPFEMEVEIP